MKNYKTNKTFKDKFPKNLIICCSDGRFIDETLNFAIKKLKIKEKDLLVLPGGAAFLSLDEKNLEDRMNLLIEKHNIKRVAIFSHIDCGFYKSKFSDKQQDEMIKRQLEDLNRCKEYLLTKYSSLTVECYFVNLERNKIVFVKV